MRMIIFCLLAAFCMAGKPAKVKRKKDIEPVLKVDRDSSVVEFEAVGNPGFLKIHGKNGKLDGFLHELGDKVSGSMVVDLNDLDTGIPLRNQHMKEKYLDVKKYPKAVLILKDFPNKEGEVEGKGDLIIREISKPVDIRAVVQHDGDKRNVKADFGFKISEYPSLGIPSYLGVSVAEQVRIHVEFTASK